MENVGSSDEILQQISQHYTGPAADLEKIRLWIETCDKEIRRLGLDFRTTFEIANQINSKGLDTLRIESHALATLRGQFGVIKVQILRQEDMGGNWIGVRGAEEDDKLGFNIDGVFAQELAKDPSPLSLRNLDSGVARMPEITSWKEAGFEVAVPLLLNGTDLKGVILMGPKFTQRRYSTADFEFLALIASMVAIAMHNAQLYMRSIQDSLTMVFTRGHFDIQLEQEIDRLKRYQRKSGRESRHVSLIMLDVDHFKVVNDNYGHQVGDMVLIEVANLLKNNVRSMDVVARYGGEEFSLICPETSKSEATILAERIRKAMEKMNIPTERFGNLNITASLGVATFPEDADSSRELILQSDMAMYRAKENGRNRVVVAISGGSSANASTQE
ncbi:diguanylate cyclase [Planctomycetota bacterium]